MSVDTPRRLWLLLHWYLLLQRSPVKGANVTLPPLPPDWDVHCPYTDFCTHRAAQTINLTKTQRTCCDPCSCEPDCGLKRNCCTYALDRYRIEEQEHVTCTLLSTVTSLTGVRFTNHYLTIDKCPDGASCYYFKSAPWGSMSPVASRVTRMIYLNDECAHCNGETDIQRLKIEVNCLMISAQTAFVSGGIKSAFNVQEDIADAGCFLRFLPSSADVLPMRCAFRPPISSCLANASTEMRTQCLSFNATYTTTESIPFANVYCRECNRFPRHTDQGHVCHLRGEERRPDVPFSFILNMSDISDLVGRDTGNTADKTDMQTCARNELMERETRNCRRFHCPEGQMLLAGECSFLSQEWTAGPFVAYLRLEPATPEDRFPLSQMLKLSSYRGKFFKTNLHTWWRKLYYRKPASEGDTHVSYFVLALLHKKTMISPHNFINSIKQSLNIVWKLRISKKTYAFKVSLHNCSRYMHGAQYGSQLTPLILNQIPDPTYIREVLLAARDSEFRQFNMHIAFTRAFLCKRVDLLPEEFVDRGSSLFLKVTNRSLGLAEFWKSPAGRNWNETVAVCADDLGPHFWYRTNAASTCILAQVLGITILLVTLLTYSALVTN